MSKLSGKLSFRARPLDASKPMPIYMAEELPDLPDYSAINRAVPQMPSGMQKEEESEHHLQRAICAGLIIPTPEVTDIADVDAYERIYSSDYKLPRQLIHMQPFAMEQDIPDYDMDSEDEKWVTAQSRKMDITPLQFEEMMDRLEKSSGQNVVTLDEAKALLKEDDDLIIAVFDYWLNKRLKTQHPLILTVKTENRPGTTTNNPYLAFRRRTEKMQTRKIRKNDEASYEKMLKLRRDLTRAVTLLELVKRREKTKREYLHLTIEIYEKRYQAQDFSGQILNEVSALKASRPAFAPLFTNQFGVQQNWANKICGKEDVVPRKEKRQYKKRKHKTDLRGSGLDDGTVRSSSSNLGRRILHSGGLDPLVSSDEDSPHPSHSQPSLPSDRDDEDTADEGPYAFRRNKHNSYLAPVSGNWPWCDKSEGGLAEAKYRFSLTSINNKCLGYCRRRMGRGGRIILDRYSNDMDDLWSSLDFKVLNSSRIVNQTDLNLPSTSIIPPDWPHFQPKTPPPSEKPESSTDSDSETEQMSSKLNKPHPYPFPPEATSICIDFEPDGLDEAPFTSEFNITDYFPLNFTSEINTGLAASSSTSVEQRDSFNNRTKSGEFLGSSCVRVLPDYDNVFSSPQVQSDSAKYSAGSVSVNMSSSNSGNNQLNSSQVVTAQFASAVTISETNNQFKLQQKQFINNSSNNVAPILSKSLTSPNKTGSNSSISVAGIKVLPPGAVAAIIGGNSSASVVGNGHQQSNGPIITTQLHQANKCLTNSNSGSTSGSSSNINVLNNQLTTTGTILLPQKHPTIPSNTLGYSKLITMARQQQQQQTQNQTQQVTTPGEITLNSNSEAMEMEVDEVQDPSCDSKTQQQQLVQANKTNSVAMEVT